LFCFDNRNVLFENIVIVCSNSINNQYIHPCRKYHPPIKLCKFPAIGWDKIKGIELQYQKQTNKDSQIKRNAFHQFVLVFQKSKKVQEEKYVDNGRQEDKRLLVIDKPIRAVPEITHTYISCSLYTSVI
jgi:hypothetical protein